MQQIGTRRSPDEDHVDGVTEARDHTPEKWLIEMQVKMYRQSDIVCSKSQWDFQDEMFIKLCYLSVLICFCFVVAVVYLLCVYFSEEVGRVKGGYGRQGDKC